MSRVMVVLPSARAAVAARGVPGEDGASGGRHRSGETLPHAPPDRLIPPDGREGRVRAPPGGSPPYDEVREVLTVMLEQMFEHWEQ
jgi:hypothetical protein